MLIQNTRFRAKDLRCGKLLATLVRDMYIVDKANCYMLCLSHTKFIQFLFSLVVTCQSLYYHLASRSPTYINTTLKSTEKPTPVQQHRGWPTLAYMMHVQNSLSENWAWNENLYLKIEMIASDLDVCGVSLSLCPNLAGWYTSQWPQ